MVYWYHDYNNFELFNVIAACTRPFTVIRFANDYLNLDVYVYNQDAFYIETYVCER